MVTIKGDCAEYYTVQEIAAHFNVSYKAIQQYLKRHKYITRRYLGKTILVRMEDFSEYQRRARRKVLV
jgi:predicted DNA-binding protein YlxM (UPF0122 family)